MKNRHINSMENKLIPWRRRAICDQPGNPASRIRLTSWSNLALGKKRNGISAIRRRFLPRRNPTWPKKRKNLPLLASHGTGQPTDPSKHGHPHPHHTSETAAASRPTNQPTNGARMGTYGHFRRRRASARSPLPASWMAGWMGFREGATAASFNGMRRKSGRPIGRRQQGEGVGGGGGPD